MNDAERFAFKISDWRLGDASYRPMLPIVLTHRNSTIAVDALLDTGATINVLPFHLGSALGAIWEQQRTLVHLAGNLAQFEARALVVSATVGRFPSVLQAFAWVRTDEVPLLLGQVNFFQNFDVCFYRSSQVFEIRPVVVDASRD